MLNLPFAAVLYALNHNMFTEKPVAQYRICSDLRVFRFKLVNPQLFINYQSISKNASIGVHACLCRPHGLGSLTYAI